MSPRQAKRAGVQRLIQISGLGADPASPSPFVRSRGIGDNFVREAFGGATILRPSAIFGPADALLNKLADVARYSPVVPLFGDGRTRLQPVFVEDVAEACARALADPSTVGRVYELGGADVFAYSELVQLLLERMGWRRIIVPVPFGVWDILAGAMAWYPECTADARPGVPAEKPQCGRGGRVDLGRPGHSPGAGGRRLVRLSRLAGRQHAELVHRTESVPCWRSTRHFFGSSRARS